MHVLELRRAISHTEQNNKIITKISNSIEQVLSNNLILKKENVELKEHIIKLETQQRRQNLVFEGIGERKGETDYDCYEKIVEVMSYIPELNPWTVRIARCHRLGPFESGKIRGIIVNFHWFGDRQYIMKCKRFLPGGVIVHEDFPQEVEDRRRVLKPILHAALNQEKYKKSAFLAVDKLIIDRKAFTVQPRNNLHELPADLQPDRVAQKSNDQTLVFFGQNSAFSNFHPASFKVDGVQYTCNEQFIQSKKAELFNDDVAHSMIMSTKSPYAMKKIGGRVRNFDKSKWNQEAPRIARKGVHAKFSQNEHLKKKLLDTGTRNLAEATKEKLWGCGVSLRDNGVLDSKNWSCRGLMGDTLIAIRDALKDT